MNKVINGISYVTVPEADKGACTDCVANELQWLCDALEINDKCIATDAIWKKESEMSNVVSLIDTTAKEILNDELLDCAKSIMSTNHVDKLVSMALDDIENDDIRVFIEDRMDDVEGYLKKEFLNEKMKTDCESIIEKFPSNLVYYDGFPLIYDQVRELLTAQLRDEVVDNHYNELEKFYLKDFYEILQRECNESIGNMVKMAIKQVDEETMTNMINESLEQDIKVYLSIFE